MTKDTASLTEYVKRMNDKQEHIFYMASGSAEGGKILPSVEGLPGRGCKAADVYGLPGLKGRKLKDVTGEGPSKGGGTRLAFLMASPLVGEDGPTRAGYREDRLLAILDQPFGRARAISM